MLVRYEWETLSDCKVEKTIDSVVSSGLCTRCGACAGICPKGAVRLVAEENYFPRISSDCTFCGLCLKACGGWEVNSSALGERLYGRCLTFREDAIGPIKYSEAGFSQDDQVRKNGSSGGLVSQILLDLLAVGSIDGAVVVGFTDEMPPRPLAMVARSREEILGASQSKYCLFPVAHVYREIVDTPGRYAVVGLPCQIHSLRKWQEVNVNLRNRVVLVIGLFCHLNLEPSVVGDLLKIKRIDPLRVRKLEFRGGEWPGGIRATLENDQIIPLHPGDIKDGAFNYLKFLYGASRCRLCTDFSAELADIAISDPWLRNHRGEFMFQGGWSVSHVRTPVGEIFWDQVKARGHVKTVPVDRAVVLAGNRSLTRFKKQTVVVRLALRRKQNLPTPEYYWGPDVVRKRALAWERVLAQLLAVLQLQFVRLALLKVLFSRGGIILIKVKSYLKKKIYWLGAEQNNR